MNQSKDTGKRLSYVHNIGNRQRYDTQEMKKQVKKTQIWLTINDITLKRISRTY